MKKLILKILLVFLFGMNMFQLQATESSLLTCDAFFTYEALDATPPVTGGLTFFNESVGDFTNASWDFGDGSFDTSGNDSLDYFYANDGVYNVCLTVWNDQNCLSTFCADVIVGSLTDICNLTDCVFPGDTNNDGDANFYDLLQVGIGHGTTGPVRPDATIDWVGQLATDWAQATPDGINYKHLDCDGNGTIDENDALAIDHNYGIMDAPNPTTETGAPLVYIEFDQDTIYVDVNSSSTANYVIKAHLKVGNQNLPAEGIYGLALYLSYPSDLVEESSVSFQYDGSSFLGNNNEVLWMRQNNYDEEQLDIGATRVDGIAVSGFGEIGEGEFIINDDIIDGRVIGGDVNFPVYVHGVMMIDSSGNELPINLTNEPANLVFTQISEVETQTNNLELSERIKLFPNPVQESLNVDLGTLQGETLEVFNNFGQRILEENIEDFKLELNAKDWNAGIYFIKIQTQEGVVSKRFVVD